MVVIRPAILQYEACLPWTDPESMRGLLEKTDGI